MGGEQLAILGDSLKITYPGDLFSYRGTWGLESWSIWPQISHLIRGRTQVPYLPVQPPFHHPTLLTYSNTVQVCYILTIRPWIVTLQACSGVASDSCNPHLYWNSRASWNLFLDLTSTCKGLTCSALNSLNAVLEFQYWTYMSFKSKNNSNILW